MNLIYFILLIIFIFGLLGIIYITYYNNIQYTATKIEQAESTIDEVLRRRYDLVVRTSDIIKTNLTEKKDYLKEYVSLKDEKMSNFEIERKLKEAINIILNLRNDYPNLKSNPGMKEIMVEIKETDEILSASIAYYNRYTNSLNELIRKFPSNIIAKFHNLKIKTYFDGKDMNDNDLLDFKL